MQQLKLGTYKREEIAELMQVKITNHFKRDVTNKLDKWGYKYSYSSKSVEIIEAPCAATDKLKEIMIRTYGLDIQIDIYGFACFMFYLNSCEEFQTSPWEERAKMLKQDFNVDVNEKTMRRWAQKLLSNDMLMKDKSKKATWVTTYVNNQKRRYQINGVEGLERDMKEYFKRRTELVRQHIRENVDNEVPEADRISLAWSSAFGDLWKEYHCCYYTCDALVLNALGEEGQEIIELVEQICGWEEK